MMEKNTLWKYIGLLGKWMYALSFLGFGINQFVKTGKYVAAMPDYYPFPKLWIYLTGIAYIAGALSFISNYQKKIGALVITFFLLIYLVVLFLPDAMSNKTYIATYLVYIGAALFIGSEESR